MADRYWVGGTGTWNTTSTTNWSTSSGGASGASVPTAADNVFFDQAGTYTVTMTGALACLDFTVSAGAVTFAQGTTPTLSINGNMSMGTATVWNASGNVTFDSTTTGKTVDTNGVTINSSCYFQGIGGGWQLTSNLTLANTKSVVLWNGDLDLNNKWLTTGVMGLGLSNTRSINWGTSSTLHMIGGGLDGYTTTNLTYTGAGIPNMIVNVNATSATTVIFYYAVVGGSASLKTNLTLPQGSFNFNVGYGGYFHDLDYRGFSGALQGSPGSWSYIYGNVYFSSTMTASVANGREFFFMSTTQEQVFGSNGVVMGMGVVANNSSSGLTLLDNLSTTPTQAFTHTRGTLNMVDKTINCGFWSSTSATARTINFGNTGAIIVNQNTNFNATTLTLNGNGIFRMANSTAKTFAGGGANMANVVLDQANSGTLTITGSNTLKSIRNSYRTTGATSITLTGTTQTLASNDSLVELRELRGASGSLLTITGGTLTTTTGYVHSDYLSLSSTTATGSKFFAGRNSTDGGSVTGWVFGDLSNRIDNTGNTYINGILDETVSLGAGVATTANTTGLYAVEFDEVTINPVSAGLARKVTSTGGYQIAGTFDEVG